MDDDDRRAAHIAATSLVVQDLVEIMHQLAPDLVEAKLRAARLYVQELEAGRLQNDRVEQQAHRNRRDLLERGVARSRETDD
ncbi:hypothetical protein Q0812_13265 [Brevundimonas sp. 2R-24]|uniref:Uncharacterized protein n=1 Tax=Peiella sedimenti TaxID=3061083 RepID=A0ABT8SPD7_9CAUL|nr:hypothetical protein [Caulobacteraceae bacterium XZ-24]